MKRLIKQLIPLLDWALLPLLLPSALVMKIYRRLGSKRLIRSTNLLKKIGVFPIRDHYYEPLFNDKHLSASLREPRNLPGINFNELEQIELLKQLTYQNEFLDFVESEFKKLEPSSFKLDNGSFESGDAEFLFNFIRHIKPRKVIEIGCGTSTKIIQKAIGKNDIAENRVTSHVCVEPYEQPWLEKFPKIKLIRDKVENLDVKIFQDLEAGDLLFIDSSHMIRPQGDVVHEYLSIIPSLKKGVFVHIHDIFTPHDYLDEWVKSDVLFWNEQYLLEALLTGNSALKVVASLNMLKHRYYDELKNVCPFLTESREPGSFYLKTH